MATITDSDGWVPVTRPEITDIALGGNETNFPGKFFRELASRDQYLYETALGGDATSIASAVAFRQLGIAAVAQGRLTLETGVPVSTTDQTAKTVLYYTPYSGDYVALYDTVNTRWDLFQFTERSLSLSGLAANTNYDIFIYNNSGTLTLQAVAWATSGAGTSTRASAITQLDGVWVKDSDKRRYLGTIRTTATTGQCEDSKQSRFVWNIVNQVNRIILLEDTTSNVYSGSYRYYGGTTTNQINLVNGLKTEYLIGYSAHINGDGNSVACGLNSTTPINTTLVGIINSADFVTGAATISTTNVASCPIGFNYISLLQSGDGSSGFFGAQVAGIIEC
ncbi:MAG: hypothetical protein ACO33E_01300, partial [Aquiluna sp.]